MDLRLPFRNTKNLYKNTLIMLCVDIDHDAQKINFH